MTKENIVVMTSRIIHYCCQNRIGLFVIDNICTNLQVLDLMTTSISTRFNSQSAPILRGLGYLGPERLNSQDALKNIQKAVDWYKDDLEIDLLEGQLLSLQKSQSL